MRGRCLQVWVTPEERVPICSMLSWQIREARAKLQAVRSLPTTPRDSGRKKRS